jgi:hypothetical protein
MVVASIFAAIQQQSELITMSYIDSVLNIGTFKRSMNVSKRSGQGEGRVRRWVSKESGGQSCGGQS